MTVWIADVGIESSVNGYYQTEKLANSLTSEILSGIKNLHPYKTFSNIIGSDFADSYFTAEIKTIIWPLVKDYIICINETNQNDPSLMQFILVKNSVVFDLLRPHWPKNGPQLQLNNNSEWLSQIKYSTKMFVKNLIDIIPTMGLNTPNQKQNRIGVECCRIELLRNSILRWIDHLAANRTTLCLLRNNGLITSQELHSVRSHNIPTIDLDKNASQGIHDYWRTGIGKKHTLRMYRNNKITSNHGMAEQWINQYAEILLRRVDFWRNFYNKNQIKVYVHYNVNHEDGLAKQIALNLEGGTLVFVQRSHIVSVGGSISRRSCHICFCWGNPVHAVGTQNYNNIDFYVISGSNDEETAIRAKSLGCSYNNKVSEAGAKFVISIFDNASSPNIMYGQSVLNDFYTFFIRWLMDDPNRGLIIKPKKNLALELTKDHQGSKKPVDRISKHVHDLLTNAIATGRCLILDDTDAPESAAYAADISVGLGLSTASYRSAVENLRAIHWDPSKNPDAPLTWLQQKGLIFHDLGDVMNALTIHEHHAMSGDTTSSTIGDHSAIIEDLDPFQDGKANARISDYLKDLIEGYDLEYKKDQAIDRANKKFILHWGQNKIVSGTIALGED